jgi:hypothetical protein
MGRLMLAILCLFVATGTVLATQPKAQKKHSISHKKTHVKSKPVSLRELALRYGDGPTFEGDPDTIRLSSLLFYGTPIDLEVVAPTPLTAQALSKRSSRQTV